METVTLPIAFLAGILSFFSPCILPIVPAYLLCIAGLSYAEFSAGKTVRTQQQMIINALLFIAGFSLVFILLGAAAGLAGAWLFGAKKLVRILGGALIIALGLYVMGLINLTFLPLGRRADLGRKSPGRAGAFMTGIVFAVSWTPCVGPVLGSILLLAGAIATLPIGVMLLTGYALGLAVPFFICALFLREIMTVLTKLNQYAGAIKIISGLFLVVIGILLLLDKFGF
ncbi:MAG: cytochrome c biogenesis protein CcdA [Candidatus Margulisiibacteriota bacterium]